MLLCYYHCFMIWKITVVIWLFICIVISSLTRCGCSWTLQLNAWPAASLYLRGILWYIVYLGPIFLQIKAHPIFTSLKHIPYSPACWFIWGTLCTGCWFQSTNPFIDHHTSCIHNIELDSYWLPTRQEGLSALWHVLFLILLNI